MGILSRAVAREKRSVFSLPARDWWEAIRAHGGTPAVVTPRNALTIIAVYAAVRLIAESVGSLPLILYERTADGGKRRATQHPLYELLHDQPNPEMTAVVFRETLQAHLGTWGNAYAQIVRDRGGRVRELWPLRPDRMTVKRNAAGALEYHYEGVQQPFAAEEILHIPALGFDGLMGYSPIALARRGLWLLLAAEEYGARFFENDARPGVVLKHPDKLTEEAYRHIKESWEESHSGVDKAHKPAILEEGMDIETVGLPPQDSQFLETRKFQVTEIARLYRIPPHMLADLDRATFSNIEHQGIEFVVYTLRPWLVRWEQAIRMRLLTPTERKRYFAEHLVDGLLRGDIKSRYEAYNIGRNGGWLSANDIRSLENMNPIPGGDTYWTPMNMMAQQQKRGLPAPGPLQVVEQRAAEKRVAARRQLIGYHHEALLDAFERVARREANDIANAAKKYLGKGNVRGFLAWLDEFLQAHGEWMQGKLRPVVLAYARAVADAATGEAAHVTGADAKTLQGVEGFVDEYLQTLAQRWTGSSAGQVRQLVNEADASAALVAVSERMDEWRAARGEKEARREGHRLNNAVAKWAFAALGVRHLVWVTFDKSCPYCKRLDGKVVGIEGWFVAKGEVLPGNEEKPEFVVRQWVGHPPLHAGCDCMITAA